jgi:hypothetical protein
MIYRPRCLCQGESSEDGPDPGEQHWAGGEPGRGRPHHPREPHPHHILRLPAARGRDQDGAHQGGHNNRIQ